MHPTGARNGFTENPHPFFPQVATPPLRSRVQKTPPTYSPASAMTARTIIIDHGSGYVKSGFSGWNEPQLIHPNIVNYRPCRENPGPSSARRVLGLGIDSIYPDTFSYPIQRGRVLNWEGVEHIWSFVLEKHKKGHEVSPVLVTESPLREPMDRKKTLEVSPSGGCHDQGAGNSWPFVIGHDWPSGHQASFLTICPTNVS